MTQTAWFDRLAKRTAGAAGRPATFAIAVGLVAVWIVTGPLFGFSDSWQLVINTATTIVTFLMVFLLQCTQNRDTHAIQIKLDEIIRVTQGAHNALLDLEELGEDELERLRDKYEALARKARENRTRVGPALGAPHVAKSGHALPSSSEGNSADCVRRPAR